MKLLKHITHNLESSLTHASFIIGYIYQAECN